MYKLRQLIKKLFTPITIMLVPHTSRKTFSIKMPSIGIFTFVLMGFIGIGYVFSVAVDTIEYHRMKGKLNYYKSEFFSLKSTISTLKMAESEFKRLFSLKSKEDVLENMDTSDKGSIDIETLKSQIKKTVETVSEIKDYLRQQRDIYMATPKGWPASGNITSGFGSRVHPISRTEDFHAGIDISAEPGSSVRATADGVVSFSGWSGGSGNLVVIEHGFGFSTLYAHNKTIDVRVGQKVKRGEVITYLGSTGSATGPHVHYEVWRDGRAVNPMAFVSVRTEVN